MSSFGFGGANAHAVLDDARNYLRLRNLEGRHNTRNIPPDPAELESASLCECKPSKDNSLARYDATIIDQPRLLIWSAFDEVALENMLTRFRVFMASRIQEFQQARYLDELALTLAVKRSHLPCRTYVIARSMDDLGAILENNVAPSTRVASAPKLGFVFTGQGAQWPLMGLELLSFPVYKQSVESAGIHLQGLGCEWDIIDEISSCRSDSNLAHPVYSQPICTIIQVALVDLLASWGIHPTTVVGHSSGEIAAAYCAGAISRESAWDLAYHRGTVAALAKRLSSGPLAMMAVGLSETDFQGYWDRTQSVGGNVAVACINSPQSITISGCERRIDTIKQALDDSGISARKLNVDVAYHTTYMECVSSRYIELIGNLDSSGLGLVKSMFSSVTGKKVSSKQLQQSNYWVENMTSAVQFRQAVENAFTIGSPKQGEDAVDYLLEIGPHSVLQGPLKQILRTSKKTESVGYSSVLMRSKSALETALEAVGKLFCKGFPIDMAAINRHSSGSMGKTQFTDLPSYPWNHVKRYWLEGRLSRNHKFREFPPHELLGTQVSDWNPLEPRWRHTIRLSESSWIGDHKVCQFPFLVLYVSQMYLERS